MNTARGTQLIESYMQGRQRRFFRGHHDDEFFFLVSAYHGRLHVHMQASGSDVDITVTAEHYFPAARRAAVAALVQQWNDADLPAVATVSASCDPQRIGVVAERRYRAVDGDFGRFVDQTVQSAIDLFGRLRAVSAPSSASDLRDAG